MAHSTPDCDALQDQPRAAAAVVGRRQPHTPGAGDAPGEVTRGHKLQVGVGLIDWLAFTLHPKEGEALKQLADWLLAKFPQGAIPLDRGNMGYTHGYRLPAGGLLLYNPQRRDMGVHCECPSGLLALLDISPRDMIISVMVEGGVFTRLDVAIDTDQVTIDQVDRAVRSGELVSRSQVRRFMGDYSGSGYTVYVGAGSSQRLVRFYDKAAEQNVDGVWTRCEVQFRSTQAQTAATYIATGEDLRSLILSAVDFRDVSTDGNISRRDRLSWWEDWIGSVGRLSFAVRQTVEDAVIRAYEWVRKQVAPTLAFLDLWFRESDPHWIFPFIDANRYRIKPELRSLLAVEGGVL